MTQRWVIMRHTSTWYPPTDIYEHNDRLVVVVEVAGMRDADFNITLHNDRLIISGVRERIDSGDCAYHQLEIPFGAFRTEVMLPWPVVRDEVMATYRDGFLRIELPRSAKQQIQIVNVDAGEPG